MGKGGWNDEQGYLETRGRQGTSVGVVMKAAVLDGFVNSEEYADSWTRGARSSALSSKG